MSLLVLAAADIKGKQMKKRQMADSNHGHCVPT